MNTQTCALPVGSVDIYYAYIRNEKHNPNILTSRQLSLQNTYASVCFAGGNASLKAVVAALATVG